MRVLLATHHRLHDSKVWVGLGLGSRVMLRSGSGSEITLQAYIVRVQGQMRAVYAGGVYGM